MSLIICRKENETILIVSDTKLTYPTDKYPDKQSGHPSDGVIKTLIINTHICISFAGDVEPAEEGIRQIQPDDNLTQILNILKEKSSGHKTDFIVCTSSPNIKIFEIKDTNCVEVQNSWIGSSNAFSRFQGYFHNQIQDKKNVHSSFIKIEPTISKGDSEFGKVLSTFDKVIGDSDIYEVGGFKVTVILENGAFRYRGYIHNYMGRIEFNIDSSMINKQIPIGHGDAGNGSFMVNFLNSKTNHSNIAIHILQGGLGIVYSRKDNGLLRPKTYLMDEVDFFDFTRDTYDLWPTMTTQDRELSYFAKGDLCFKNKDYKTAITWFEKISVLENGKIKAKAYYAKGICLLNLKRHHEGIIEIQKAIDIEPSLQNEAMKLFPKLNGRK